MLCITSQVTTRTAQVHFDHPDHRRPPGYPLHEQEVRQLQDVVADLAVLAKAQCQVGGGWVRGMPNARLVEHWSAGS
jgi:hypothetical protein